MMKSGFQCLILPLVITAAVTAHAQDEAKAVPISVVQTITRPLQINVSAPGEIESIADPVVAAEADGRVLQVLVQEGEAVAIDQSLAVLDPEPYEIALEQAQAEVFRIEALIRNQRLTVKRIQDLMRQQSAAQRDLDEANTQLIANQAQLAAAKARVKEAEYQLARTDIKSPIKGRVQVRHVSAGDYVKKGDPAFQVVAVASLSARLFIPEALLGKIKAGLPVALRVGGDQRMVKAEIIRLLPALDPGNRALAVMADFRNDYGWRPGMSVSAEVSVEQRQDAIMVPVRSVVQRPAGTTVYLVKQGRAIAQTVELGQRESDWVEVVSGLSPNMPVAADGAGFLTDGAAIEIQEPQP